MRLTPLIISTGLLATSNIVSAAPLPQQQETACVGEFPSFSYSGTAFDEDPRDLSNP